MEKNELEKSGEMKKFECWSLYVSTQFPKSCWPSILNKVDNFVVITNKNNNLRTTASFQDYILSILYQVWSHLSPVLGLHYLFTRFEFIEHLGFFKCEGKQTIWSLMKTWINYFTWIVGRYWSNVRCISWKRAIHVRYWWHGHTLFQFGFILLISGELVIDVHLP